ncbi:hypothetical protein CULT_2680003 [[Clostridium] ultunense Esp]|nr:hypothetical protein CULT_2680003 [[Clostridium] ultunense Esp]
MRWRKDGAVKKRDVNQKRGKTMSRLKPLLEVLAVSTKLGLTSFGGPIAHLGYFYDEYIRRRKWMDERSYTDLVALCQFLPGPASSQVGIGIGVMRAGLWGGVAAWIGFTVSVKYGPHAAKIKSSVTKKETKLRFVKFTFGLPGNLKARRPTKEGADRSCLYPSNRYSVAAQRDR